jgi:transposase
VNSHIRAFSHIGGVTEAVVTDNLKSGVTRSHRYEPEIARTFEEFGAHFGTTIFPVRAGKPRDKAKVEKAVQEAERWVLAPLRNIRFRSLAEINAAMTPLTDTLNARKMKDYDASRRELFESVDKPALRPLPVMPFLVSAWKRARVSLDYHIEVDRHYYSVPYIHVRKEVAVKRTEKLVEVFLNNERIASHVASRVPYRFTTLEEHMPPEHKAVRSWTAENFAVWARGVGSATENLVSAILNAPRFKQQGFRSILGIQRLEKRYGSAAIERAAAIAVERRLHSQRALHKILETLKPEPTLPEQAPATHGNLRGGSYFH